EFNGGRDWLAVYPKQFVRRAVARRRVSTNPKTIWYRFEDLLLRVNALLIAPPPCPVYERSVSWIHQTNDGVIDIARKLGSQVGELVTTAEYRQLRHRWCFALR